MLKISQETTPRISTMLSTVTIEMPSHDAVIQLVFPGGKTVTIQSFPSAAFEGSKGSLDFVLPEEQLVENCQIDLEPARTHEEMESWHYAQQLTTHIP